MVSVSADNGVLDNFGNSGLAGDLGDGVDGGCADDLGDNVASLDGGDDLCDDWDINAMFGRDLSAGSLDGLGDGGGEGDGNGSVVGISGITESTMESTGITESTITENLCVSFSISFTFDNMSDKSSMSISKSSMSNVCAVFVDDGFASLLVGDFFADNIGGAADGFGSGCARLDFNLLS